MTRDIRSVKMDDEWDIQLLEGLSCRHGRFPKVDIRNIRIDLTKHGQQLPMCVPHQQFVLTMQPVEELGHPISDPIGDRA
jgi:hypothetical protein